MLVQRLALALVNLAGAQAEERDAATEARVTARKRSQRLVRDARARLAEVVGRTEAHAIAARLDTDRGLLLRATAAAAPLLRDHVAHAVLAGAEIAAQHEIASAAAMVSLARATRWGAISAALLDLCLTHAPGNETWAGLLKLAAVCDDRARLDLVSALELERRTRTERDAGGFDAGGIDAGFVAELIARAERERARPATGSPEDATGDPEPHRGEHPTDEAREGAVPGQQNTSATLELSTESRDSVGRRNR